MGGWGGAAVDASVSASIAFSCAARSAFARRARAVGVVRAPRARRGAPPSSYFISSPGLLCAIVVFQSGARRGGSGGVRLERRAPADRGRCAAPPVPVIEAAWPVLPSPMAEGAAAGRRRCAPLPKSGALLGPDSLLTT